MTETRFALRNIARRPIERHQGGVVTIMPADATIEVDVIDDAHAALIDRGLITAHPLPAAPPAVAATSKASPIATAPTKSSRRKGEGA